MRRYIIAGHGNVASGFVESLKIIIGSFSNLLAINAYVNGHNYGDSYNKAKEMINRYPEDEFIIMTDLLGGSVNTELMSLQNERVHIIAGINLAILLIVLTSSEEEKTQDLISRAIKESRESIIYCNSIDSKDEDI